MVYFIPGKKTGGCFVSIHTGKNVHTADLFLDVTLKIHANPTKPPSNYCSYNDG